MKEIISSRDMSNIGIVTPWHKLKTIEAYGLSKKISLENIKNMYKTMKGFSEAKKIIEDLGYKTVEFDVGPVIGTHVGKGMIVIIYLGSNREDILK